MSPLSPRRALILLSLLISCGAPSQAAQPAANVQSPEQTASAQPKTITLAQLNRVTAYAPWGFGNTSGGGSALAEIHTNGLVSADASGRFVPQLAAQIPSLDAGSVLMLPDGRMQTTWTLRPGVKWHDGTPLTADDIALGWQVHGNPELTSGIQEVVHEIVSVDVVDPQTAMITWSGPYYRALSIGFRELWPEPVHLLADAFQGDKQAFLTLPYFTTDYVNLGPFRLVDFGLGENQVFERFDDYFLGRPKLDRIIIRSIPDSNALLVNLRAGAVDVTSEKTLPLDAFTTLQAEFSGGAAGVVVSRQENWRYIAVQFDPQWARPLELSRDVRIRRGLLYGVDRVALREFLFPGLPGTDGDTFMPDNDTRSPIVGKPFSAFTYQPDTALRAFADAGWQRAPDGHLLNASGQPLEIELRGSGLTDQKEVSSEAEDWRQLGILVDEVIPAENQAQDNQYTATFPGVRTYARAAGDQIFTQFDSRLQARPENRWLGANAFHYANPDLDRLIDQLYVSVGEAEQGAVLRQLGEMMATDLPALPMYYRTIFAVIRPGISGVMESYAGTRAPGDGPGLMSRSSYLWDRT